MSKYALPVALLIIAILLICNTTTLAVAGWHLFRNPVSESYAIIRMGLEGEGSGTVHVSRHGVDAKTHGGAEATVESYIYEPELLSLAPPLTYSPVPTFTPSPQSYRERRGEDTRDSAESLSLSLLATALAPTITPTATEPARLSLSGASRYRLRSCPRQDCSIEGHLYPGQSSEIIGKDDTGTWFLIREQHGRKLWVSGESTVIIGHPHHIQVLPVDSQRRNTQKPIFVTPTPMSVIRASPTPVPVSRGGFAFQVAGKGRYTTDYDDEKIVRFHVWIHGEGDEPAGGISFAVRHNGIPVTPTNQDEFVSSDQMRLTWPRNTGNRQKPWNAKIEFRDTEDATGQWAIYPYANGIANGVGVQVGPTVLFDVGTQHVSEQRLEFYIEYAKGK